MATHKRNDRNCRDAHRLRVEVLEERTLLSATLLSKSLSPLADVRVMLVHEPDVRPALSRPNPNSAAVVSLTPVDVTPASILSVLESQTTENPGISTTTATLPAVTEVGSAVVNPSRQIAALEHRPSEELSGRKVVGGIHTRHPDWQVDTTWVQSGDFTVSNFLDWLSKQSTPDTDVPTTPVSDVGTEVAHPQPTDHTVTPSTPDIRPDSFTNGNATAPQSTESPLPANASIPEVFGDSATAAPEANNAATLQVPIEQVVVVGIGQSNLVRADVVARSESDAEARTERIAGAVSVGRDVQDTASGQVVSVALIPETTEFAFAALDATQPELASETDSLGFNPLAVGLHTSLTAANIPAIDFGALGEQVAELVTSLVESETGMLLVSCLVVIVAAGVGCEIVRRHHARARLQLVVSPTENLPDYWLLS